MYTMQLMKTIYVFNGEELSATLKEQTDKTLKVDTCSISLDELKEFLCNEGFSVL